MARREAPAAGPGSRALVVDLIRSAGTISRAELVTSTGLTQPSISNIVRDLISEGLVYEQGPAASNRGKPRTLIAFNPASHVGVGFQLGADTLTCVAIDLTGGVVGREMVPAEPGDDVSPEHLAQQFDRFVTGLDLPRDKVSGLAVVRPAPLPGEPVEPPDLAGDLSRRLNLPVTVENDSAAAALGEFWSRRVSRSEPFGCVYLSTGIGAGFVFDGALVRGASAGAGELGHTSIHYDGRACPCGNRGCVERYASMAAVVDAAREDPELRHLVPEGARRSSAYDAIARAAVAGHPAAFAAIDRAAQCLAVAVTSVVNLLDLGRLVLTGPGVALAGSIYAKRIRTHLELTAHSRGRHQVLVELSAQPRDAAGIGAAALMVQATVAPGHSPGIASPPQST
jgi:predicted NBD/HSP70 family sugar kinase